MARYQPFFNINISHAYFSGAACKALTFVPTDNSVRLMKNAGLLYSVSDGGINVQGNINNIDTLMLFAKDNDEPFALQFKAYITDPNFSHYTQELNVTPGSILYFDQRIDGTNKATTADIAHVDDFTDTKVKSIEALKAEGVFSRKDALNPPYLIFNILITAQAIVAMGDNKFIAPTFTLTLPAQSSFWKYYVLANDRHSLLTIIDKKAEISFELMGIEDVGLNQKAMIFQSTTPLSLYERSPYNFQLISKTESFSKVLINRLSVANVSQVNQQVIDGSAVSLSEIYINF